MVLLSKDLIQVRAVSYDTSGAHEDLLNQVTNCGIIEGQNLSNYNGQLIQYTGYDCVEDYFFVPAERTLGMALDELARAKLDSRVGKEIPAKIFVHSMVRLPVEPAALMAHYQASILSSLSGFVKKLLRYRVDLIEIKFRLVSGENIRLAVSSSGEFLQPTCYLEYLNPLSGHVARSADLQKLVSGTTDFAVAGGVGGTDSSSMSHGASFGLGTGLGVGGSNNGLGSSGNTVNKSATTKWLLQKRTLAHKNGTTYVYDFPRLLKLALLNRLSESNNVNGQSSQDQLLRDSSTMSRDPSRADLVQSAESSSSLADAALASSPLKSVNASMSRSRKSANSFGAGSGEIFEAIEIIMRPGGPIDKESRSSSVNSAGKITLLFCK